ncbi:hypothetical protein OESDEN_19186, partial [Oesophagostomum dentatum]
MSILTYLHSVESQISKEISKNLYVDNILLQADTVEEAVKKYHESKQIFASIGMNLREYISNSTMVNASIPEKDLAPAGLMKVLGVHFDTNSDEFIIKTAFPLKAPLTKKDVVSQINSVYDPLGFAGPLTIKLKCLMREVYDMKLDWKDQLPEKTAQQWIKTCSESNNATIKVPRLMEKMQTSTTETPSLWVFSDA